MISISETCRWIMFYCNLQNLLLMSVKIKIFYYKNSFCLQKIEFSIWEYFLRLRHLCRGLYILNDEFRYKESKLFLLRNRFLFWGKTWFRWYRLGQLIRPRREAGRRKLPLGTQKWPRYRILKRCQDRFQAKIKF